MNNVKCLGSEMNLDQCHFEWSSDCSHSQDALVECYNISVPIPPSTSLYTQTSELRKQIQEVNEKVEGKTIINNYIIFYKICTERLFGKNHD